MWLLYFACLIPVIIGGVLFVTSHKINWIEWIIGSVCAFIVAGGTHYVSFNSQTADFEVWSGQITHARQFSRWHEAYQEAVYRTETYTTGSGKNRRTHTRRVFSHWRHCTRWHEEYFVCYSNIDTSHYIEKSQYIQWKNQWQNEEKLRGDRSTSEHNSHQIGGDPYDYITRCPNKVCEPIHVSRPVVNRLKAAQSVFNFAKVSPEIQMNLFKYPEVQNSFQSGRLFGTAAQKIRIKEWDKLNAKLGPLKKVNLILVGFDSTDHMLAEYQKSLWLGGKKNDLILIFGNGWARVYGWSDSDILKKELEKLLLENQINEEILPKIEELVINGYEKTNWHKFDHLAIEPNGNAWFWFFFFMVLTQAGLWFMFHGNQLTK